MKFDRKIAATGLLLVALSSCKLLVETPENHAVLEARYQKMNPSVDETKTSPSVVVKIKSDLLPDSVPKKKTLLNFSNEGQKALINAYNGRAHTDDAFKGFLGANYFTDDPKANIIDFTTRTISLTISVQNKDFFGVATADSSFADRLEKIRYTLVLDQTDVYKFKSWNKVNTQFGKFYVGSRAYTGSQTGTLSPSLTVGTATFSAGSLAGSRQFAEADTILEQYISSNGILSDDNFVIEQDGTPKTTLMGNTIVQLTIKAKHIDSKHAIALDKLTDDDGKPVPGNKVKLTKKTVLFPIFPKAKDRTPRKLTGTLSFDYVLRHINHGYRTFAESDDEITYHYGTVSNQQVNILAEDDLGLKLYYVTIDNQFVKLKNTAIADPAEQLLTAAFLTNDEALAFMNWLQQQPDGPGPITIAGTYQVVLPASPNGLTVLTRNYLDAHNMLISEE